MLIDAAKQRILTVNDDVLAEYLAAEDDRSREQALSDLLVRHADPIAHRVIARFRSAHAGLTREDADDIAATVHLRLIRKLRAVLALEEEAVERFEDYVATLAYHATYDFLRRRFPARTRLKNRTRYLLAHDPLFDLWTNPAGSVCGLREWQRRQEPATAIPPDTPAAEPEDPRGAILSVLRSVGRPVLLDDLVRHLADVWKLTETTSRLVPVMATDPQPLAPMRLEARQYLDELWREVLQLRPPQRIALLLNMRDADGSNALANLLLTGVASFDAIAAAVEMSAEELAAIWNGLPLDDLTIASRLGVTRQQVINLRKAARERLARRLGAPRKGWP